MDRPPQQIVPGGSTINVGNGNFALFRQVWVGGSAFLAYGSGSKVVVVDQTLCVVALLKGPAPVRCLDWSPQAKLAVAFEDLVVVYLPEDQGKGKITWNKERELVHDFAVHSLAWRPNGTFLLVCGESLVLWDLDVDEEDGKEYEDEEVHQPPSKQLWKSQLVNASVRCCEYSPDGNYFATVGDYDRLVKVWYRFSNDSFRFIYLPHVRSVVNLIWRKPDGSNPAGNRNVLLTMSRDSVARLWLESGTSERLQFAVCAVIEPGQESVVDWLNTSQYEFYASQQGIPSVRDIHPTLPRTMRHSIGAISQKPSLDWIISVQKGGNVIIWKIKGLVEEPKRTPGCSIWSRFTIHQAKEDCLNLIATCHAFTDGRNAPSKFELYLLGLSGTISYWDCTEEGKVNPSITPSLVSSCFGHHSRVHRIIVHPSLPLVASLDDSQKIILWKSQEPKLAESLFVLNNWATLRNTPAFAWSPAGNYFIAGDQQGIYLHRISLSSADRIEDFVGQIGLLRDSNTGSGWLFLHVFPSFNGSEWRTLGISSNGAKMTSWLVNPPNRDHSSGSPMGQLSSKHTLNTDQVITCAAPTHPVCGGKESGQYSFVTGGIDGAIRFWEVDTLHEVASLQIYKTQVDAIACGSFGYIATTSQKKVHIWRVDIKKESALSQLEHILDIGNSISDVSFDWLSLNDGHCVLGVAMGNSIRLVCPEGTGESEPLKAVWQETEIKSSEFSFQTLAWSPDGSLIAGAQSQLVVHTKWNYTEAENNPTIFHQMSAVHRPLPFYHPRVLAEYLAAGQFDKVGAILNHLLEFLSAKSGGEESGQSKVPSLSIEILAANENDLPESTTKKEDDYSFLDTAASLDKAEEEANTEVFPFEKGVKLSELLAHTGLPLVSGTEQMLLLAVIDTFSHAQKNKRAIDECGVRFLLSYNIYSFMRRSVPAFADKSPGLSSADFAWALHSEAEDNLLQKCLPSDATWPVARSLGVSLWVRNSAVLRQMVEKMAKTQFMVTKDPNECALFYLVLNKKPALVALFKAVKNETVHNFIKNDFTQEKWKTGALKNAYALLGKQRFELAAAFFLLAGSLKDAVNICLQRLQDYQLALLVARLVEGEESPVYKSTLDHILEKARAMDDHALASIALWWNKRYDDCIMELASKSSNSIMPADENATQIFTSPSMLHLFNFLRTHTMLRNTALPLEKLKLDLMVRVSETYSKMGHPLLALQLLKAITDKNRKKPQQSGTFSLASALGRFRPPTAISFSNEETQVSLSKEFLFQVAVQLLSQVLSSVETIEDVSIQLFKQDKEFLCTALEVDEKALSSELLQFCEARHLIFAEYHLLSGTSSSQMSMILSNALNISHLCDSILPPQLFRPQSLQLLSTSRQLFKCFEACDKTQFSASECSDILCSVKLGAFFYSWKSGDHATLLSLLALKNLQDIFNAADENSKPFQDGNMDEELQEYIKKVFDFLVIQKFCDVMSREVTAPISLAARIVNSLRRWSSNLKGKIALLPKGVSLRCNIDLPGGKRECLQLFSKLVQSDPFHHSNTLEYLWDFLCNDEQLLASDVQFSKGFFKAERADQNIKFIDTAVIYKDKDILQGMCINSTSPNQIAMATTRGIREITLHAEGSFVSYEETDHIHPDIKDSHSDSESEPDASPLGKLKSHMTRSDSALTLSPFNFIHKYSHKKIPERHLVSKQIDHNHIVQWLESHPVFPYYLSGGIDGTICLWQFNSGQSQGDNALMATYTLAPSPRVNRIHFNARGTKFGACDMTGDVSIWRFDANESSLKPFQKIQCNSKRTLDFTFMNSGSLIATSGVATDKRNVCVWDALMPPDKSLVSSFLCHESGASSVVYSPRHQLLFSGGKKGDLVALDVRQQKTLQSVKAHAMNVKSIAIDPLENYIITGSSDGDIKAWAIPGLECIGNWGDVHMKHTFVRKPGVGVFTAPVSTYGVMQVTLSSSNHLYSCGSDGRLLRTVVDR